MLEKDFTPASPLVPNRPDRRQPPVFDAAVVPGGPIMQRNGEYVPVDYTESINGTFATHERVAGLLALYACRHLVSSPDILFTGGYSEPVNGFVADRPAPSEAAVCKALFLKGVAVMAHYNPKLATWLRPQTITVYTEEQSRSSIENSRVAVALARSRGWKQPALITNDRHRGRMRALLADPSHGGGGDCFSVESGERWKISIGNPPEEHQGVNQLLYPHLYDETEEWNSARFNAYVSVLNAHFAAEAKGLDDLNRGCYTPRLGQPRSANEMPVTVTRIAGATLIDSDEFNIEH